MRRTLLSGTLLSATLLVPGACGGEPDSEDAVGWNGLAPRAGSPPAATILVLSLDTLRADHLGLHGYARPTTPRLEAFARRAVVYEAARSTAPWTLPAHASMFTGLYPFEHRAHTYESDGRDAVAPLAQERRTLAEVLAEHGYRTGAVAANVAFLAPRFQLDQGFESYHLERGDVRAINARALAWLDEHAGERRFLFLNYMDTHRPYNCVPRAGFPQHGGPPSSGRRIKRARRLLIDGAQVLPEDLRLELVDQYDTAIANLDEGLGELFDALAERGLLDDALIVITSDHGEFLGEHAWIEHSKDVYEPVVHVPLLVRPPGGTDGARDARPISLVHLPGMVLSHAGLGPADAPELFAHWPRAELLVENHFSRQHDMQGAWLERLRRVRRALYADGWKYIASSDGAHELYDLAADPGETRNLFADEPARAAALASQLERRLAGEVHGAATLIEVGDDEAMQGMGYAGDDEDEDEK